MSSIVDIIGPFIFFGAVLLIVIGLNASLVESSSQNLLEVITQEKVTGYVAGADTVAGAARIVESDLYKVGNQGAPGIILADTTRLSFRGDVDNDGAVDTVRYFVNPYVAGGSGCNPKLRLSFLRRQNSQTGTSGRIPLSTFRLAYYDSLGRNISPALLNGGSADLHMARIKSVKVQMQIEAEMRYENKSNPLDTAFAASYWEKVISPRGLRTIK
jgi:hypothetical protein